MEEIINSILYGKLEVEIPPNLILKQQLEIVRALVCNSSAINRIVLPKDMHPWVSMILTEMKMSINNDSLQTKGTV